ncbi:MAG TPA: hypothetical protein VGO37_20700 [Steroidobacteraceae bacterium]|jgi:hypothetical protein|nr:hypothetical protein [Steroidobacteraceae bacterium]
MNWTIIVKHSVRVLMLASLVACGRAPGGALQPASASHPGDQPRARGGHAVLSKEEVGAILGSPVTSVEGAATDMAYKTSVIGLETSIGIESSEDSSGAINGARKATGMLGGTPEDIPNLGDEAFFGAMSILYVRAGDTLITITPPNLQLVAATAAYGKVTEAKDSDEQSRAMQELLRVEKTDPLNAGLKSGDGMQGALAMVAAASKKQGTPYETQARSMALALAAKVLGKR